MDNQEEDFSKLSIQDKLQHKVWKARVSACEDLTQLFRKSVEDADFYTYEPFLKKMVIEPNAVAQEAGLSAVLEYVSNAPNASSTRETVVPALVEKCLGATKAGTKQKATDIILLYAEIDTPDPVLEFVLPGLNAKQPKIVLQTVTVLKELVQQFGVKKVNPKPIIKVIPKLFGHSDSKVRAETSALTVELYRWIGQPLMTSLSDLKPVQIKDLEEAFSKLPAEKPTPTRLIRAEQAAAEEAAAAAEEEVQDNNQPEEEMEVDEIDAFDLADPVDITAKLQSNFYELLASKKWQERREALDALLEQAKTPKILDKDYSELMGALAKRINDANILLVGATATCIEHIANGLRQDFGKYKPIIAPVMIEKLKERKPAILEQLANGLNAVFASVPMSELIEDVTTASKHKNPQVRSECFKLLSRRLKEVREIPGKAEIKAFAEMFKKLLDDADANARESGAEGLGTLMKLIGEKPMLAFTDGLDDIKMGKIKEACEKATVKAKPPKKAAPPPPAPAKKAPVKKPAAPKPAAPKPEPMVVDNEDIAAPPISPPKRKPPAKLAGASSMKKPALSSSKPKPAAPAAASSAPKKSAKLPPPSGPEEIKYRFTPEDAEARATEFIPESIHTDLQQAQWKIRLAAIESLYQHFESVDEDSVEPEIVIRSLAKKPGWKEMNFQVMGKLFATLQLLATRIPKFNKACAALCIPAMVEKLGDIKLKKPAGDALAAIAETISLPFVLSQAYPVLKNAKSPKVLADSLIWIHGCLMDFGIAGLQVRDLIDLLKSALSNTNPAVRTSAVTVLGALRQYIGPEIKSFVEDVSPALMALIEQEFEKVSKLDPPQPTKTSKGLPTGGSKGSSKGGNAPDAAVAGADAMEDLFPRVDISGSLNKTVAECGDANWKIRKEGLDKVMSIISGANNRIKPSLGAEFPGVLKQRLNDSNKNLQIMAVEITGSLATAMGKPFDKYAKIFTGPVIAVLSDNKANVRAAGVTALENIRKTCSMESMAPAFGSSLANESPALRKEFLTWFSTAVKEEPDAAKFDFTGMITPLFACLQDRNADVRKAAQACLPELVAVVGYDVVVGKTSELKAAQRQTVMPLVEATRGSAPASSPATAIKSPNDEHVRATGTPSRMKTLTRKKIGGIPTPRSQVAGQSATAAAAASEDSAVPILTSDPRAKQVRAKKEIRWQFDAPRPDILEGLKALFEANMSPELTAMLFSNSQYAERDRLNGLNILNECLSSPDVCSSKYNIDYSDMKKRLVANADLILKYLTIRFFDTNTSMLIKCLDLTQNLVAIMDEEAYNLTEYEAVSFLPFLINKIGDPKETMRSRIRSILQSLCRIYPVSKMLNYLLDAAASSKNAKARAECLEEVGSLIQKNGMSIMLPNKALPLIAAHIGDRDASVRNAALGAVAQAYILIGDAVMKYMTRLGDKEKSMLEERLKRTTPSASVLAAAEKERAKQEAEEMEVDELPSLSNLPRRSQIGKPRAAPQRSVQHVHSIPEPEPMEDVIDNYGQRVPERQQFGYRQQQPQRGSFGYQQQQQQQQLLQQQQQQPQQRYVYDNQDDIVDYLIAQITSGDPQPSIDALKSLDKFLTQNPEAILPDIEALINAITLQVRLAYSNVDPRQPSTTRLCKHLVNALVLLFSNRDLAVAVPQSALHHLLQELAHRLLDQKMAALESGPQLSKALNVAMVKVLENGSRNVTFSALLSILGSCSANLKPGDSASAKDTKYTELIMKCLWKLAKTIQDNLRTHVLNPDELLYEINRFFITTPPTEWKRRASEKVPLGEMPLRTVKTLLLELVNGLGDSIFQHLTLIENPQRSSVYPYLHHMLEACRKRERLQQQQQMKPPQMQSPPPQQQPPVLMQHDDVETSSARLSSHSRNSSIGNGTQPMQVDEPIQENSNNSRQTMSDLDLNVMLTKIFQKIGTRDETKQGIVELYEFQKNYPLAEAKVNTYLVQTGSYFQSYIRRGLSNLAAEDNELQAAAAAATVSNATPTTNNTTNYTSAPPMMAASPTIPTPASITPTHSNMNVNTYSTPSLERQSIDSNTSQNLRNDNRNSMHGDDTAEIKLRLLRLQQKFGYKTENDDNSGASNSGLAGINTTDLGGNSGRSELSPTYSNYSLRRQSSLIHEGESDRQQSVHALKEKLARMKQEFDSKF